MKRMNKAGRRRKRTGANRQVIPWRSPISVIVPVYNGERYLAEAVASVRRQDQPAHEIIVVDDGSTDGTAGLIRSLGADLRAIHQPNAGPAAARNRGLGAAKGELIAFLDADDWWPDASLSRRVACLLRHPDLIGVIGATQVMLVADGDPAGSPRPWGAPQPTLNLGGALIRREAFARVGAFDEAQAYAEDAEWLLRAREAGLRFGLQGAVALMARRHAGNMTNQIQPSTSFLARALHRSLTRRRAGCLAAIADLEECDG
jgi:glycosyltransferase involved in cell wall biosynthesis